jgi:hypothetical protein
MDISGKSTAELNEMLIQLASSLKEEDLQDAATFAMVSQLVDVLDPKPAQLPNEVVAQIRDIQSPEERFRSAAMAMGIDKPEMFQKLTESMKAQGLLKTEQLDEYLLIKALVPIHDSHILMFPATIRGRNQDPKKEQHEYHVTLKWMGNAIKDHPHNEIQDMVNRYQLHPPHEFEITPHKFKGRDGSDVHVLLLNGRTDHLARAHDELSKKYPALHPNYLPHITVEKDLYDQVVAGNLTAKDLNIKIHPLEYRVGNKPMKRFIPAPEASEHYPPMKMAKAEIMKSILHRAQELLEKSKNVREQKKKLFGESISNTSTGKTPKQHEAMARWSEKNLGLDIERMKKPSEGGGKETKAGTLIDKPVLGQDGKIKHIGTGKSVIHEVGHIVRENVPLNQMQNLMDKQFGEIKSRSAQMQMAAKKAGASREEVSTASKRSNQFAHEPEYETQGIEQKLSRRMGLPSNKAPAYKGDPHPQAGQINPKTGKPFPKYKKGPKDASDPVQTSQSFNPKEYGKEIHKLIPSGKHITHLSSNISPELKTKIDQIDSGELKYDKTKGFAPGTSVDSKINAKAAGRGKTPLQLQNEKRVEPPQASVKFPHDDKDNPKHSELLAASEFKRGMSFNDMKKLEKAGPSIASLRDRSISDQGVGPSDSGKAPQVKQDHITGAKTAIRKNPPLASVPHPPRPTDPQAAVPRQKAKAKAPAPIYGKVTVKDPKPNYGKVIVKNESPEIIPRTVLRKEDLNGPAKGESFAAYAARGERQ